MSRIVIFVHPDRLLDCNDYYVDAIAQVWRESGHQVVVQSNPNVHVDADVAMLHVDLSRISDDYVACVGRYPAVINGKVRDISKSHISRHLVCPGDGYDGPVIVKTDLNHGGLPEAHVAGQRLSVRRLSYAIRRRLPWYLASELPSHDYRVFDRPADVPGPVWRNPALIVERFLPERRDGYYCIRTWIFLGDREISALGYANCPVVKASDVVRREDSAVPDELRTLRAELGFDFAKFDYAITEEGVVLYDANWTPTLGGYPEEHFMPQVRLLAEGIATYL